MLGAASTAQASKDDSNSSGEYSGGSLFGPMPGQIFNYGRAPYYGAYGYAYAPGIYGRGRRAFGYAPSLRQEYPWAPWDEY
jgi:hypothetical protein